MDVDLSTDLGASADLLAPLLEGRADVVIGSRLAPGRRRSPAGATREVISRSYNILLRGLAGPRHLRRPVRLQGDPPRCRWRHCWTVVQDDGWFFDTELLYHARRSRLAIHEVPVRWVEDTDSRVQILATVREDLQGIHRLRRARRRPPSVARTASSLTAGLVAAPSRRTA